MEVHPKVAGQPRAALLQVVVPRLQKDKQLQSDAIQNTENAIADLVSKGEAFAGRPNLAADMQPLLVCQACGCFSSRRCALSSDLPSLQSVLWQLQLKLPKESLAT